MKFPSEWEPAKSGIKPSNQPDGEAESLRSSCAFCCLSTVNKSPIKNTLTRWSESWPGTNWCWYHIITTIPSVAASLKSIIPRGCYSKEKMMSNLRSFSTTKIQQGA